MNRRGAKSNLLGQDVGSEPVREYKCVYVLNDEEICLFSDEAVVNCAP
jgi:hypothetical protein